MHIKSMYDVDIAGVKSCETLILDYMRWKGIGMQEIVMQEFRRWLEQRRQWIEARKTLEEGKINRQLQDKILSYYVSGKKLGVGDIKQKTATTYGVVESIVVCVIKINNRKNKVALYKNGL